MAFPANLLRRVSEAWFGSSDYYSLMYTFYVLGGIWMLRKKYVEGNAVHLVTYRVFQVGSLAACTVVLVSFLYDAYLIRKNIEKLSYNLGMTVFFTIALFRFIVMTYKKDEFEDLLETVARNLDLKDVGTSPRDVAIFKSGQQHLKQVSKIFFFMLFLGAGAKMVGHMVTEKSLPIPFPYLDDVDSPFYEILFALESLGFTHYIAVVIAQEMITFGVFIRVLGHFTILSMNVMEIENVFLRKGPYKAVDGIIKGERHLNQVLEEYDMKCRQRAIFAILKKSIIHHQEILKVMKRANDALQEAFFTQIFGGGLLIVDLFLHLTLKKNSPFLTLCQLSYSGGALLDITFACYYGSEIEKKSHDAARTLYSIDWLEMDSRNRHTLRFFQLALWKHPVVKAGNVFSINLNMYLKFLNSIYSYLAFMKNSVRSKV